MKTFITSLLAAGALSFDNALTIDSNGWASLQITENGSPVTLYVAMTQNLSHDQTLVMPYNGRGYLSKTASLDPTGFYAPNLLGGSVEYDVDLSQSNCGCIAAFYLVGMPGKDRNGNFWNTDGYYYCDANQVDGNYCPEFDIMEANQWSWQTTAHSCNAPSSQGFYDYCNRSGACWQNNVNKLAYTDYGPGSNFKIDTTKQFHTKIDFQNRSSSFGAFTITLTQDGKQVQMVGDCGTNAEMSYDLAKGMVFAISNWSTFDNWLWGDRCQAQTCTSQQLLFKNISITTGGSTPVPPTPPTPPTPGNYTYGNECGTKSADYCDGSCDCRWSWPSDDPAQWSSSNAACRCKY